MKFCKAAENRLIPWLPFRFYTNEPVDGTGAAGAGQAKEGIDGQT